MADTWFGALARAAAALGRRRSAAEGEEPDESGFTLIELMVVLLIMGILMAIAIPTFLGVTNTANDRSTQSNLTNALTSAKAIYTQANGYATPTHVVSVLKSDTPPFTFVTGASAVQNHISVYTNGKTTVTPTGSQLILAAYMTKTKVCWIIKDTEAVGTTVGVHYGYTTTTCNAATIATLVAATTHYANHWPTPPQGK